MPLYEYRCPHCSTQFECVHKMSDSAPETCPHCQKGKPERVYSSSFGMHFKGDGFYVTDYKAKESSSSCCQGGCQCSKQKKE